MPLSFKTEYLENYFKSRNVFRLTAADVEEMLIERDTFEFSRLVVSKKTLWPAAKTSVNPTCRWQDDSWNYFFCSVFTKWYYSLCRQTRKRKEKKAKDQVMFQGQRIHPFPKVSHSPLLNLYRLKSLKPEILGKDTRRTSFFLFQRN